MDDLTPRVSVRRMGHTLLWTKIFFIDFFITHVSDVENSYHLEIHGLKSLLVKMDTLV